MAKRMQPIVALKALRQLIANPDDTDKVFEVIRAMAGDANERCAARFMQTDNARKILDREQSLLDSLMDREKLRSLAPGSLGRTYLGFMERESITADGLVAASENDAEDGMLSEDVATFGLRLRDQHDLWHVVTGYGRDVAGEDCLLAFTYAQTKNRGLGLICLIGALNISRTVGASIFKSAWYGYRAGKRAAWLPEQDWENLLAMPLDDVRRLLNISPPVEYLAIPGVLASAA